MYHLKSLKIDLTPTDTAAYIAMALSVDKKMGDDSAIECVKENGIVKAYTSYTRAMPNNYGARRSEVVRKLLSISCFITTLPKTSFHFLFFNQKLLS